MRVAIKNLFYVVTQFHNGRGSQEVVFGDTKQHAALGAWKPTKLAPCAPCTPTILSRELQMLAAPHCKRATAKRFAAWTFETLDTLRHGLIQRDGRLTRPQGELILTMSGSKRVKKELMNFLDCVEKAA